MISRSEAVDLVTKFIGAQCRSVEGGVAIVESSTRRKPYGWIFFYNSRRYLETKSPLEALGGNGPVVVLADNGEIVALGTGMQPEDEIAAFERRRGLAP